MKRALLVFAAVVVTATTGVAAGGGHVKATLEPVGGSGVAGTVQLVPLPHGGTNIHVNAHGLTPGVEYSSFYYDGPGCLLDPDLVGTYTANRAGVGTTHDKADEDLDEIGSVSVRSPDYSILFACADVD